MNETDRTKPQRTDGEATKQVPIGLVRLRQHFVEPLRKNAKETAAAGVVAGLASLLGSDDEAPADDGGAGPSRTLRRARWLALAVIAILAVVFIAGGLSK